MNNTSRQQAVHALAASGKKPAEIARSLAAQGFVNPTNGKPYSRQTIRRDLRASQNLVETARTRERGPVRVQRGPLAETIGKWTYTKPQYGARILLNVDTTWKDYTFWDALRRGEAPGYLFSGPAFCLPASQTIASYVFGRGISANLVESAIPATERKATLHEGAYPLSEQNGKPTQNKKNAINQPSTPGNQPGKPVPKPSLTVLPKAKPSPTATDPVAYTNLQIQNFLRRYLAVLLSLAVDIYCLGNVYVFVNSDCTLSVASPETVTVEYSASDYRRIVRVIVRTKMQNAVVEDVYTDEKRVITTRYFDKRGTVTEEYENLIGRIPMVHFANDRSMNEIYGRPLYEGGLPIMQRYDELISNMLEGVTLLGTPIPMFTNLDNPDETKRINCETVTYTDDQGDEQTQYVLRIDRQTGIFLGKGGDGKMLSTNVGFTKDSLDALRELKLQWLNETHIPEFILGGAIASSKASTETQFPPFIQYINFRRLLLEGEGADPALGLEARGGILELINLWLRTYKLLNPSIVVAPVQLKWPAIDLMNDQLKYMYLTYFNGTGKITDQTALELSGYIDDAAGETLKAAGKKPRPTQFDDYDERLRAARLKAARDAQEPANDDGKPWASDYGLPMQDRAHPDLGNTAMPGSVDEHQHFEGEGLDEWGVLSPLPWIGQFSGREGSVK